MSSTISGIAVMFPKNFICFSGFLCLNISPTLGFVWSLLMVIPLLILPLEVENSTGLWFGIGLSVLWILGKQLQAMKAWMAVDLENKENRHCPKKTHTTDTFMFLGQGLSKSVCFPKFYVNNSSKQAWIMSGLLDLDIWYFILNIMFAGLGMTMKQR